MSVTPAPQPEYTIKLPVFEGPLDLLLHLIREHKLDIYDIPISKVTDQYLHYLSLMESLDLNIAGEFFVMAATLLEIKSKMLLPIEPDESDSEEPIDPRADLVEKLLEYERFKNAAESLKFFEDDRRKVFWRLSDELSTYDAPVIPLNLQAMDLIAALQQMLNEVSGEEAPVTSIERQKVSLRLKMREVLNKVRHNPSGLPFRELCSSTPTKEDIIVTFLALLELLKMGKITVKQKKVLGEILIKECVEKKEHE
jgi:segregation and condensation protein A